MTDPSEDLQNSVLKILFGTILLLFGFYLLFLSFERFSEQSRFLTRLETVKANIDNTEDVEEDCGKEGLCWEGTFVQYHFILDKGRRYQSDSYDITGVITPSPLKFDEIGGTVEIEYLPQEPGFNRIRGTGIRSYAEIFKQNIGAIILMAILLVGGFFLVIPGIKVIWNYPENPIQPIFKTIIKVFLVLLMIVLLIMGSIFIPKFTGYIFDLPKEKTEPYRGLVFFILFICIPFIVFKISELIQKRKSTKTDNAPRK